MGSSAHLGTLKVRSVLNTKSQNLHPRGTQHYDECDCPFLKHQIVVASFCFVQSVFVFSFMTC